MLLLFFLILSDMSTDLPSTGASHMLVPAMAPLTGVKGEEDLEEKEEEMGDEELAMDEGGDTQEVR